MTIERDPETGRILPGSSQFYDPEIQQKAQATRRENTKQKKLDLLTELGFKEPFETDLVKLAEIFLLGKANSISAYKNLYERSPLAKPTPEKKPESRESFLELQYRDDPNFFADALEFTELEITNRSGLTIMDYSALSEADKIIMREADKIREREGLKYPLPYDLWTKKQKEDYVKEAEKREREEKKRKFKSHVDKEEERKRKELEEFQPMTNVDAKRRMFIESEEEDDNPPSPSWS